MAAAAAAAAAKEAGGDEDGEGEEAAGENESSKDNDRPKKSHVIACYSCKGTCCVFSFASCPVPPPPRLSSLLLFVAHD